MRRKNMREAGFVVLLAATCAAAWGQTIRIKVEDGRTGKPLAHSCVSVWVDRQRDPMVVPTDENGVAQLGLTANDAEVTPPHALNACGIMAVEHPVVKTGDALRVETVLGACNAHGLKLKKQEVVEYATKTLLEKGIVSPNGCGKIKETAEAGELVLFVRPLRFWEDDKDY